jgi:hypothetical protein
LAEAFPADLAGGFPGDRSLPALDFVLVARAGFVGLFRDGTDAFLVDAGGLPRDAVALAPVDPAGFENLFRGGTDAFLVDAGGLPRDAVALAPVDPAGFECLFRGGTDAVLVGAGGLLTARLLLE